MFKKNPPEKPEDEYELEISGTQTLNGKPINITCWYNFRAHKN